MTANVVQPPVHTRRFTLKEIMVATKNFDPQYVIGSGGFGLVYKGHLENNAVVAVKRATEASQQGMTEFFTGEWNSHMRFELLVLQVSLTDVMSLSGSDF